MKKLSRNEYIAVAAAFGALVLFAPFFFDASRTITVTGVPTGTLTPHTTIETVSHNLLRLGVNDLIDGNGTRADLGDRVYIHYVGHTQEGDVFDTSTDSSVPYSTTLGNGEVILGWDVGLVGMREGGTRHLVVPPEFAYGAREVRDAEGNIVVPANATLHFDIVLLKVEKQ